MIPRLIIVFSLFTSTILAHRVPFPPRRPPALDAPLTAPAWYGTLEQIIPLFRPIVRKP